MAETLAAIRPPQDDIFELLNVLVVDDMPPIRRMLRQMLRHLGVRGDIQEANDGLEAWAALQNQAYQLVVCDINMPRMNGLELLKRFRADQRYESTPFLLITGEVSEEIAAAAAESEVDGYLLKPFRITTLKSRLRSILMKHRQPSCDEHLFRQARKLKNDARPQEALALMENWAAPPLKKEAKMLNLAGECHLALGAFPQASQNFSQALQIQPQYLKALENLATLEEAEGNLEDARHYLEQVLALGPPNPERFFHLGRLCLKCGDQAQARRSLEEALRLGQTFSDAERVEAAEICLEVGLHEVAENLLKQAVQAQPGNASIYSRLGLALSRQQKHREALECYQSALRLDPEEAQALFYLRARRLEIDA